MACRTDTHARGGARGLLAEEALQEQAGDRGLAAKRQNELAMPVEARRATHEAAQVVGGEGPRQPVDLRVGAPGDEPAQPVGGPKLAAQALPPPPHVARQERRVEPLGVESLQEDLGRQRCRRPVSGLRGSWRWASAAGGGGSAAPAPRASARGPRVGGERPADGPRRRRRPSHRSSAARHHRERREAQHPPQLSGRRGDQPPAWRRWRTRCCRRRSRRRRGPSPSRAPTRSRRPGPARPARATTGPRAAAARVEIVTG